MAPKASLNLASHLAAKAELTVAGGLLLDVALPDALPPRTWLVIMSGYAASLYKALAPACTQQVTSSTWLYLPATQAAERILLTKALLASDKCASANSLSLPGTTKCLDCNAHELPALLSVAGDCRFYSPASVAATGLPDKQSRHVNRSSKQQAARPLINRQNLTLSPAATRPDSLPTHPSHLWAG